MTGEKSAVLEDADMSPFFLLPRSTSLHVYIGSSIASKIRVVKVSSGCRLDLNSLSHLFGTVVGQTQAHDGQHHGYLVDGTVLWLSLHLTSYLPLEEAEVSGGQSAQSDDHVCGCGG